MGTDMIYRLIRVGRDYDRNLGFFKSQAEARDAIQEFESRTQDLKSRKAWYGYEIEAVPVVPVGRLFVVGEILDVVWSDRDRSPDEEDE